MMAKYQATFECVSEKAKNPVKSFSENAGYELFSSLDYIIPKGKRMLISTDLIFGFPFGFYGKISAIPELAAEKCIDIGLDLINPDKSEPIEVLLINNGLEDFVINKGDKIAQLIIVKFCRDLELFEVYNY